MRIPALIVPFCFSLSLASCAPVKSIDTVEPRVEYYQVKTQQMPYEPVYGRLSYSHLPKPLPSQVGAFRSGQKSKLLQPVIEFEMPSATLSEALEALSQTIGYELQYPKQWAGRSISMKLTGTVEEVLTEIERQARVVARLDHEARVLRIVEQQTVPRLPGT